MDSKERESGESPWRGRLRTWAGPAAAVGAFSAFTAAVFRTRPEPAAGARPGGPLVVLQPAPATPPRLPRAFGRAGIVTAPDSAHPFRRSLACVAVGKGDKIFVLGDSEIRVFDRSGALESTYPAPGWATCMTLAGGDRVVLAGGKRIEVLDASGRHAGGFDVQGPANRDAVITAVRVWRDTVLAADAAARVIVRHDFNGRRLGDIGGRNKTGGFMLPNRVLDFDVDASGTVVAGDPGRHRVTFWGMDGSLRSSFGKFGMADPADFVGCCNPVDIAWTPQGNVVSAEKMIARVKLYDAEGRLLALIGAENFDPQCTSIRLAVDSSGRIITADPVRRQITIFAPLKSADQR